MSKTKKYEPTNPNKNKTKKLHEEKKVIVCPHCGSERMSYLPDRRRIPPKWYVNLGCAIGAIIFFFVTPAFAVTFAIVYVFLALRKHKVLVGTCKDCGEETLFNRPADGSMEPDFDKPWIS